MKMTFNWSITCRAVIEGYERIGFLEFLDKYKCQQTEAKKKSVMMTTERRRRWAEERRRRD